MSYSTLSPHAKPTAKPKLGELDIVRALAIIAVLLIHTTSDGSSFELMGSSHTQLLYLFVNKMCAFAVPLFILLSGLVLFYVYIDNWSAKKAGAFYLKRVRSVIVPYVLWSFFYYVYDRWLFTPSGMALDWRQFADLLPWADAKYHLYFMIIIIQFYLVFPLILWPARRYAWFRRTLPLWGLLVQAIAYTYSHWFHPIPHKAELIVTYFGFFTFGGWLGIYYTRAVAFIRRHLAWLLPLGAVLGLAHAGMYILDQYKLAWFENTWYELAWTLYAGAAGLFLTGIALWLQRTSTAVAPMLKSLGVASFGIYLMHPWILTTWKARIHEPGNLIGYNLYYLAAFLLCLLLPWAATLSYKRTMALFRRLPSAMRRAVEQSPPA